MVANFGKIRSSICFLFALLSDSVSANTQLLQASHSHSKITTLIQKLMFHEKFFELPLQVLAPQHLNWHFLVDFQ